MKVKKKRENKRQAKLLQQQSLPENPADGTETNAVVKNGHSENNESSSPPQNSKNDSDKSAKIKKIKSVRISFGYGRRGKNSESTS